MKLAVYKEKSKNFSDIEFLINNCQISEYEKIYIDSFDNGEALISNIKSGEYYDIVFLYCTYGYNNGYIIGNKIRNELNNQNISIVYVTNYEIDSSKLIDSRPIKLLTEPISNDDISEVFAVFHKINGNKKHCFKVKNNCDIKFIPYSDILYFMSTSRKISVVTKNSKYECYGKINELNNVIGFIKVHKSFLINLNYVKEYNYKSIKMLNNEYIPISQSLRTKVKAIMENLE